MEIDGNEERETNIEILHKKLKAIHFDIYRSLVLFQQEKGK